MFPTLLGPTRGATCTNCQFEFPVAAETCRPELPTRCDRCGGLCDVAATVHPGQTAELEPFRFDTLGGHNPAHNIGRWDVIAFEEPSSGSTQVKRVWGLPGEAIELRDGEAWVEGKLLRKSLSELQKLAVPVYDLQNGGSGQWWVSTAHETSQPSSLALQSDQILHFQFCRPAPVHPSDVPAQQWLAASPIVDSYSINQGLSIALHPVDDFLLSLSLSQPLQGELRIELRKHEQTVCVVLDSSGEPADARDTDFSNLVEPTNDSDQAAAVWRIAGQQRIAIGWCDGRLLLESELQSRVIEASALDLAISATAGSLANLSPTDSLWEPHELVRLEATVPVVITQLQLSRDLYLMPMFAGSQDNDSVSKSPESLAGFYVLGDNLPVSRDSRQQLGRVSPSQVLGRISPAAVAP